MGFNGFSGFDWQDDSFVQGDLRRVFKSKRRIFFRLSFCNKQLLQAEESGDNRRDGSPLFLFV